MKITKIEIQKKNKNRYNLYMDGEFKLGVHEDVIVFLGLQVNQIIDEDTYNDILLKEHFAKAKSEAMKFISYRMRSEKEVIDKLKDLDYDQDVIDTTLEFLHKYTFINDYEFTKAFIHDKSSISKHSFRRIKHDLKTKGIYDDMFQKVLDNNMDLYDFEYENAKTLSLKKYKQLEAKNKYSEYELKQRVYQYLVQKGYNLYTVKDALQEVLTEEPIE